MTHNSNVLHRAIHHYYPMFKIKSFPIRCRLIEGCLDGGSILGVGAPQHEFHGGLGGWGAAQRFPGGGGGGGDIQEFETFPPTIRSVHWKRSNRSCRCGSLSALLLNRPRSATGPPRRADVEIFPLSVRCLRPSVGWSVLPHVARVPH